ncbi:hypothetical protein OURE66S_03977 [Oligella ureolytica]
MSDLITIKKAGRTAQPFCVLHELINISIAE